MNTSNLKPFSIEEAKAGKPVVTRDGRKPLDVHCFDSDARYPIYALLDGLIISYMKDGRQYSGSESDLDLFMATVERTVWVNLWKVEPSGIIESESETYPSEEQARKAVAATKLPFVYLGPQKLTFTE